MADITVSPQLAITPVELAEAGGGAAARGEDAAAGPAFAALLAQGYARLTPAEPGAHGTNALAAPDDPRAEPPAGGTTEDVAPLLALIAHANGPALPPVARDAAAPGREYAADPDTPASDPSSAARQLAVPPPAAGVKAETGTGAELASFATASPALQPAGRDGTAPARPAKTTTRSDAVSDRSEGASVRSEPAAARAHQHEPLPGAATRREPEPIRAAPSHDASAAASMTSATLAPAPAAPPGTPAAAGIARADIPGTIGTAQWEDRFASAVVRFASNGTQVAEIRIDPPDLGPVEITLALADDPSTPATVHFASPHAAVRESLEAALPRLREMMADAGITLGNATVGADTPDRHASDAPAADRRPGAAGDGPGEGTPAGAAAAPLRTAVGLVDTFA